MKLKGRLWIGRTITSNPTGDFMAIRIEDQMSGVNFVEVHVNLADFARAVSSAIVSCDLDVRGLDHVGMKHEYKVVVVPVQMHQTTVAERILALAPFEIDGWRGLVSDLENRHRQTAKGILVSMHRYVDPETGEPV